MRKELQKRLRTLEDLVVVTVLSGNIGSEAYHAAYSKYLAVKNQLEKPMILVTTCRCGHVLEQVVETEPTEYVNAYESNRFFVYEAISYDCPNCRKKAVGGNN